MKGNPMAKKVLTAALLAGLGLGFTSRADAQELGPQRRFIMPGIYGSGLMLDRGRNESRQLQGGIGGRLMINLAPLSGPGRNLLDFTTIGGFVSFLPERDGVSARHYGAEIDVHFTDVPIGKLLDPFVLVGVGALRVRETNFAVSPGGGVRIPLPGIFELRADARDVIVFRGGTTHNPEFTAGLNLRF
jgi:hypothetical protein